MRVDSSPQASRRAGLTLKITRILGRSLVPLAIVANIAAYFLGDFISESFRLEATRIHHTSQTGDWRQVTVILLLAWQGSWLHFLQRQPAVTFLASTGLWIVAIFIGGFAPLALQPGILLAAFAHAAERGGARRAVVVSLATLVSAAGLLASDVMHPEPGNPSLSGPSLVIAWCVIAVSLLVLPSLLGAWYAQLRDRSDRIATLARDVASGEAERTADAVSADRRTIAQELHDTASAHLTALLALSAAAKSTAERGGAVPVALVDQITSEGRKLYQGFEQVLTRIRHEDRTATDSHLPGHGQRSIAEVPELVFHHRSAAKVAVDLHHEPGLEEINQRLGPLRSHIAFRVVQEALSNARKHSPGAAITATLEDDGTSLLLTIDNEEPPRTALPGDSYDVDADAPRAQPLSLGYGLEGMHDRLEAAGGSLRTGPRHTGGWTVRGLLPHPPHRRDSDAAIGDDAWDLDGRLGPDATTGRTGASTGDGVPRRGSRQRPWRGRRRALSVADLPPFVTDMRTGEILQPPETMEP